MVARIGEPEDIANAVVLVSADSGWITVQMLTVDGVRVNYIGHG
jgi:NAD(P)-dependent dehydrogenase (short-subunit alcohol dehydrogenase family)